MFNEAQYSSVLNFFYFLLMDEPKIIAAATKTIKNVEAHHKKHPEEKISIVLIREMNRVLKKIKKRAQVGGAISSSKLNWDHKHAENLVVWKEFLRHEDPDLSEILVLRYILDFNADLISEALQLPIGTVLYRINRGLQAMTETSGLKLMAASK